MSPKVLISLALVTGLAGCASVDKEDWKSKAAREFDTQKQAVCCFVGMKNLPDESKPKTDTEKAELIAQIDALKAALAAKEREQKNDLARQLEASKASLTLTGEEKSNLARQLAAAQADLAAKENERAEFLRQLEALKAQPTKAPAAKAVLKEQELFDSGSATLKPEGIKVVAKLAETLKAYPDTVIRSEGHTDDRPISTGRFPSNWELSSARATEVVRSLQKQGISPERLLAIGYGDTRPAVPNTDAESRAKNRRVEIIVVPAPATTAGAQ